jgi:hypothetical protein
MLLILRPDQSDLVIVYQETSTQVHAVPWMDRILNVDAIGPFRQHTKHVRQYGLIRGDEAQLLLGALLVCVPGRSVVMHEISVRSPTEEVLIPEHDNRPIGPLVIGTVSWCTFPPFSPSNLADSSESGEIAGRKLKGPASCTRIWVDDVNSDGKLDILVGDEDMTGFVWLYLRK